MATDKKVAAIKAKLASLSNSSAEMMIDEVYQSVLDYEYKDKLSEGTAIIVKVPKSFAVAEEKKLITEVKRLYPKSRDITFKKTATIKAGFKIIKGNEERDYSLKGMLENTFSLLEEEIENVK